MRGVRATITSPTLPSARLGASESTVAATETVAAPTQRQGAHRPAGTNPKSVETLVGRRSRIASRLSLLELPQLAPPRILRGLGRVGILFPPAMGWTGQGDGQAWAGRSGVSKRREGKVVTVMIRDHNTWREMRQSVRL
jgi:hypothetical protein